MQTRVIRSLFTAEALFLAKLSVSVVNAQTSKQASKMATRILLACLPEH